MRIVRFAIDGLPKFGVLEDGSDTIVVLKSDPLFDKIEPAGQVLDLSEVRLLSPVIPRSKIIGTKVSNTNEISYFIKPNTTVIGPDVAVIKPNYAEKMYATGNIGVVIKNLCKNVQTQDVHKYILGYTVINNISALPKSNYPNDDLYTNAFDTSCVVGPWITVDPELNPNNLNVKLSESNNVLSEEKISLLPKTIQEIVSELSEVTTLLPGDIIMVTPANTQSEVTLEKMMRIDIDGLGSISNLLTEEES